MVEPSSYERREACERSPRAGCVIDDDVAVVQTHSVVAALHLAVSVGIRVVGAGEAPRLSHIVFVSIVCKRRGRGR